MRPPHTFQTPMLALQANAEDTKKNEEDSLNPDKGLMRFEFTEALLRFVPAVAGSLAKMQSPQILRNRSVESPS